MFHDCGVIMSALVQVGVVLMDCSSLLCVMKRRFMVLEEGLGVTGVMVAVFRCMVSMMVFETVKGEMRSVWMCSIVESSSPEAKGVTWSTIF